MNDSRLANAARHAGVHGTRASLLIRLKNLYASVRALPMVGTLAKGLAAHAFPRGRRIWVQVQVGLAEGLWLNVDPRFQWDYVQGAYETLIQNILAEQLSEGGTFYDVGAHIGFTSMIAARLVGKSGAVFAFEADPENAGFIKQHVQRNGLTQITVCPLAVWSKSETLRFQRSYEFSCHNMGAVVGAGGEAGAPSYIEVNALTIDEFAENHRIPTLVKIDVEGGELEVLRGAVRVFSKMRPALICEVHDREFIGFIESYLTEKQYSVKWLNRESQFPFHLLAQPSHEFNSRRS